MKPAFTRTNYSEAGQASILVVLGLGIFLLGAAGLALDGSHLFAQLQMAQAAADAAAEAGMLSVFDGSNSVAGNTHGFATNALFTCGASDARTPCYYAQTMNGFNDTTDTVIVDFPTAAQAGVPSGTLSGSSPVNLLRVQIRRTVNTSLLALLGQSRTTVSAAAVAAIVQVTSAVPILVTHPTKAAALYMNGTTGITITGGPQRSIQVNSDGTGAPGSAGDAYSPPSSGTVDLSGAGPNGTGADFGNFGGPLAKPSSISLGTTGNYIDPASPIQDPLANVPAPSLPADVASINGQSCTVLGHCSNCPIPGLPATGTAPSTCVEYLPGAYSSLNVTGVSSAFFDPGVYYIKGGGFTIKNSTVTMCASCAQDAVTKKGMVVYDAGATTTSTSTGGFTVDTGASAILWGAGVVSTTSASVAPVAPYYGILFFEKRDADAHTGNGANGSHTLGQGNGCFSTVGTIYITNDLATMKATPSKYQNVIYHGNPCTGVTNVGEIIVSSLEVKGSSGLVMTLYPLGFLTVRQVALVN